MSGITDSESSPELYRLLLKDYPISSDLKNLDMMPGRSTELQTFKSAAVEGHADRDELYSNRSSRKTDCR